MIQARGLTKRYPGDAGILDLTLTVAPGQIFGFLGPNGAGKTTTIRLLTGLIKPDAGTATVAGFDISSDPIEVKRRVGYVAETAYLYPKLTGREFLAFMGELYGTDPTTAQRRGDELLELFELTGKAGELAESYSHGMRTKLALAGALIHQPDVLFLDEPTNGLDPRSARRVKDLLVDLAAQGRTIFLTTHVLEIAQHMCKTIAIVDKARLVAVGTLDELRGAARTTGSLEDVFLDLTGGSEVADVAASLADE